LIGKLQFHNVLIEDLVPTGINLPHARQPKPTNANQKGNEASKGDGHLKSSGIPTHEMCLRPVLTTLPRVGCGFLARRMATLLTKTGGIDWVLAQLWATFALGKTALREAAPEELPQ
jgi:hypothetical protein